MFKYICPVPGPFNRDCTRCGLLGLVDISPLVLSSDGTIEILETPPSAQSLNCVSRIIIRRRRSRYNENQIKIKRVSKPHHRL